VVIGPASHSFSFIGETFQYSASVRRGEQILGCRSIIWAVSDTNVAKVSSTGLVTSVANGAVRVTATTLDFAGSADVIVAQIPAKVIVTPAQGTLSALGAELQLSAKTFDAGNHEVAGATPAWSSSDISVVTIDATGKARATKNGVAALTASVTIPSGQIAGRCDVVVEQLADKVIVSPSSLALNVSEQAAMSASVVDARGEAMSSALVTWRTSDALRAEVSQRGSVTGISAGPVVITAQSSAASGTGNINVLTTTLTAVRTTLADPFTESLLSEVGGADEARLRASIRQALAGMAENDSPKLRQALLTAAADATSSANAQQQELLAALALILEYTSSLVP
jgi:uncharacterized protein YjdB